MPISLKTREHIRRRLAVALPKWGALAAGALALGLTIAFTSQALHFVVVSDTHGGSVRILTASSSEETLLSLTDTPPLGENDKIVWSQNADGRLMQVLRAYTVPVTADGQTRDVITTGATAAELLAQLGLTYDDNDILTPAADETVTEGSSLTLQRVEYVDYTEDVVIPSQRQEVPTSLFYRDHDETMMLQEGSDGLDTVTWRDVYIDGTWTEKQELDRVTQVGDGAHRGEGLRRAGARLLLCGAGDRGRCPLRGGGGDLHRPAFHRLFRVVHRQGGQRPAADLRHGGGQPQHHSLRHPDVHHQ